MTERFRICMCRMIKISCFLLALLLIVGGMMISISAAVCHKTGEKIVTKEELLSTGKDFDCILVLGCRVWDDGQMSDMLADRVSVGISLYESGLSDTVLMSGDSQEPAVYDEVGTMKNAAVEAGVNASDVLTDPYGLSTYESLARTKSLYSVNRILIVTQEYHLYRALYIAETLGIEAYGVSADLRSYRKQFARDIREVLARCKDVWLVQKQTENEKYV